MPCLQQHWATWLCYISTTSLHSGIGDRASCICSAHYSNYLIFIVTVSSCLHLSIQCLSVVFHVLGYVGNMYITCGDCDHIAVGIAVYLSLDLLNYCVSTIYTWLYLRCCFCCPPSTHTCTNTHTRRVPRLGSISESSMVRYFVERCGE